MELPRYAKDALLGQLKGLWNPHRPDVIPAGIPLSYMLNLPFRNRTQNVIRSLIGKRGSAAPLNESMSSDEFLRLRSAGRLTLIDLLCVLESVGLDFPFREPVKTKTHLTNSRAIASAQDRRHIEQPSHIYEKAFSRNPDSMDFGMWPAGRLLKDFALWAMSETECLTLGDAVHQIYNEKQNVETWQSLSQLKLESIAGRRPDNIYQALQAWVASLSDRERRVLKLRTVALSDAYSLQQLAHELEISRERVRQIENRMREKFASFVAGRAGQGVRWRIESIRKALGVAVPIGRAERHLVPFSQGADHGPLLLEFAGPYFTADGWYVLRSAAADDPVPSIKRTVDEFCRIDRDRASAALSEWGLDESLHEAWLTRDGTIRNLHGHLVRWDGPVSDKLAFALNDLGVPASAHTLLSHIAVERAVGSVKNAMSDDARFVRISRTEWGLASWGLPEYSGIASSIRQLLEQRGGPMRVEEVINSLQDDFGIERNSARTFCDAAMFKIEDGRIWLRSEEEPFKYGPDAAIGNAPGAFFLGPGRLSLLIEVHENLLRGSGQALHSAVGAILNVRVNDQLSFKTSDDMSVRITFPETSFTGPALGSVRVLAEELDTKSGDQFTLIFDRADMSVTARVTDVTQYEPGWSLVARLTGIQADDRMDGLAASLQCQRGEVRALLRTRGDKVVIEALPEQPASLNLDKALAELDAEMSRPRD